MIGSPKGSGAAACEHGRTAFLCLVMLAVTQLIAVAQTSSTQPAENSQGAGVASTAADEQNTTAGGIRGSADTGKPLTAVQIFGVMQRNPEVVIELKTLVADALTQHGSPTQPDAITDEMLYSQLVSSSDLRSSVTAFFRARGYLSDTDFQPAPLLGGEETETLDELQILNRSSTALAPDTVGALPYVGMGPQAAATSASVAMPSVPASAQLAERREARNPNPIQPRSITEQPRVLRQSAPYNLMSLRDLYTQVPSQSEPLKRFGSDVFLVRSARGAARADLASNVPPLDVPVGPDYVVGPGDDLTITLWGGITQSLNRMIDRDGRILLPEAGPVQVAGLTLEQAQAAIQGAMQPQFRNAHVVVTVARLRTVRVYVVGDVQRPGAYDISSLSSPLGALYAAGGPTAVGSLRVLEHLRGGKEIGEVDLYDFLLRGLRGAEGRLEAGDTLLVPAVGKQVAVYGAVKRPAIYELLHETSLAAVLDEAGGLTSEAALDHITVERIDANRQRETVTVETRSAGDANSTSEAIKAFEVKDGDRVWVAPILPYSERVVYLEGHVVRPGRVAYRDGMQLSDVLRSYQDVLPEPADRGEVVRLEPPDMHPETIDFDLGNVLIGNVQMALQPFDTIHVFGRYEQDSPLVTVSGEVMRPGSYPLGEGMTAAQLVRMAGGFKRDALLSDADLISYQVVSGARVVAERRDLRIGDAVTDSDHSADALLKPGDVLTVHQITGWNDIGASIVIEGEVAHPGSYGFQQGEHLSDVLRRAGGFRETAYPEGAVLTRPEVRVLEEKSREDLIRQIETSSAAARLSPNVAGADRAATLQLIEQQQADVLARLRSQPASGRLVIHISRNIDSWAGTAADIELRSGDALRVPKRPGFVLITGQVYNASAISYAPGRNAGWYLERAGGATSIADRKQVFIVRANGSVIGRRSGAGLFDRDVLSTRMNPGDVIVVPQKILGASIAWRTLVSSAQVAASIAITAAVAAGL